MGYYLQDYPNRQTPQYGWERAKIGSPGQKVSGVIGVHTSEAITDFEGPDFNAEKNAEFIRTRSDYGSYHTTGDADSILPLVHPKYAAWADTTNNAHAMSVSGCLQASRWLEMTPERRRAVVTNMGVAAARMVLIAVAEGYLAAPVPARRISAQEAIAGSRPGFYGHGETNPGRRYDPGSHFDWDLFLRSYDQAVKGLTVQGTTQEEEVAFTANQEEFIITALTNLVDNVATKQDVPTKAQNEFVQLALVSLVNNAATKSDLTEVSAAIVSAINSGASADEIREAVEAAMSAGLKITVTAGDES